MRWTVGDSVNDFNQSSICSQSYNQPQWRFEPVAPALQAQRINHSATVSHAASEWCCCYCLLLVYDAFVLEHEEFVMSINPMNIRERLYGQLGAYCWQRRVIKGTIVVPWNNCWAVFNSMLSFPYLLSTGVYPLTNRLTWLKRLPPNLYELMDHPKKNWVTTTSLILSLTF